MGVLFISNISDHNRRVKAISDAGFAIGPRGLRPMRKALISDRIMAACPESSSLAAALSSAVAELVCTTEET